MEDWKWKGEGGKWEVEDGNREQGGSLGSWNRELGTGNWEQGTGILIFLIMEWDRKNPIEELCMEMAVKVVELSKRVAKEKHEYKMTDQVQRAGTAIGALYGEAQYSESNADYVHKVKIALKECHETKYWLEVMFRTYHIEQSECEELYSLCCRIQKALIGCVKTTQGKMERKGK